MKNTIIFFDWDDTLFPTFANKYKKCGKISDNQYNKIEQSIYKLFTSANKIGEYYILTNGAEKWVKYCISEYLPLLQDIDIKILSARDKYKNKFPNNIEYWKFFTLNDFFKDRNIDKLKIISIGDSPNDKETFTYFSKKMDIELKFIKFSEQLCVDELLLQQKYILNNFDNLESKNFPKKNNKKKFIFIVIIIIFFYWIKFII